MRIVKWALLAWLVGGCGPPILYDADRRPVGDPLMMAPLEGGWLAVDSVADGLRAVLELQVAAPYGHVGPWGLSGLQLWTGSGVPVAPSRVRQGEIRCWPSVPDAVHCRESNGDPKTCVREVQRDKQDCYYILCAEFDLKELPTASDPIVLNVGGSLTILQLASMK